MALISIYKVVSSVPSSLDANAVYLVRTGTGFDLYVSDSTGSVAYQINSSGGGNIEVVDDTTPQLGGDLDLNNNDIIGTGNISITGEIEADVHIGSLRGEIQFKAKAGEALTKGDPVYISSYDTVGNTPIVSIADANDSSKMPCFGLANESVLLNASVDVVTFGTLSGIDTSGFSLGDTLYISTTGTLTNSKPTGESSLIQNIGKVQRVDNSAGSIKVGGAGRTNDVPNLNQGNVFIGNASNQAETRGLTLDDIAETATNKHFTASDETKLDGIESGATADQTDAEIKTAYENNANTNAFTDAEKTKLSGIAAGAEVNVNADWNAVSGDAQILNKPSDVTDLSTHNVTELADVTSAGSGSIITTAERTKLSGIEAGAEVNVNADWNAVSGDAQILNKPTTITSAEQTKLGHISVTQAVDLDTMESDIATNNAKISNATHTGDVTGATALTISDEAVTNAKMAHVATGTVKGRTATGVGDVEDLDIDTTLKTALNLNLDDISETSTNKHFTSIDNTKLDGIESGAIDAKNSFTQNDNQYIATDTIKARDSSGLQLHDDGGNGIFVKDGGNVGVGYSSPNARLHINGNFKLYTSSQFPMVVQNNGSPANGAVAKFINDQGYHSWGIVAEFRVNGSTGADRPSILFSQGYSSTNWTVGFGSQDDNFRINQNHGYLSASWGTNRFFINTSGNVGIGTTSPSQKLHVAGSIMADDWFRVNGTNGFYCETYGGGWYMKDTTYMRAYNNKIIYTFNDIRGNRFVDNNNTSRYVDASGTSELGDLVIDTELKIRRPGFRAGSHIAMKYYTFAYSAGGNYSTVHGALEFRAPQGWDSNDLVLTLKSEGFGNNYAQVNGNLSVSGSVSKGSGSFDIEHPDPAKKDTHRLRHYFVETPSAGGNIYKYQINCAEGDNYIALPDYFEHLNTDSLVWVNPFRHFGRAWGEVIDNGKKVKIVVEKSGLYNILVFGDRKDEIALKEFDQYGVEYKVDKSKKNIGVTLKK